MQKRVLIADDESTIREALANILSEAGYKTVTAVDGLRAAFGRGPHVPPELDRAVLSMAQGRLGRRARRVLLVRRTAGVLAAAAAVLVVVALLPAREETPPTGPSPAPLARHDVDASGRVDILDAFALARRIEAAGDPDAEWDMNVDGAVDGADVDLIAMAAVRLEGGSVQ